MASRSSRILCVNCRICINRIARHIVVEQDTRVVSLIAERISPHIITENDYVCQACLDILMMRVNQIIQGEVSTNDSLQQLSGSSHSQAVGHSRVCVMCGCSILRKKSDQILHSNPSELQQMMATIIMNTIHSHELTTTDRVCHPCWMRAKRAVQHREAEQRERVQMTLPNSIEDKSLDHATKTSEEQSSAMQQSDDLQQISEEADIDMSDRSVSSASCSAVVQPVPEQVQIISMQNYRRASNTATRCTFYCCTNKELHRITDDLRIKIIVDHHYYLPPHARVCNEHLLANSWDTLYDSENSSAQFTVEHIEHMFSYIHYSRNNIIDFSDPLNIDDNLFQYWLGLTKEKFSNLLSEVPQILAMRRGVTGLVGYLIKLRNGDSDESLGSLMGIPRRTLEVLMNNVRKILATQCVTLDGQ